MKFKDVVGNIFLLDKRISWSIIIQTIFIGAIIALSKFVLQNDLFIRNFGISEFMYSIVAMSIFYIIKNFKLVWKFMRQYSKFGLIFVLRILFEIVIAFSIIIVGERDAYSWILAVAWLLSGYLRIIIQFSDALFHENIDDYVKIIQIFAYTRALYYAVIIIFGSNMVNLTPFAYIPYILIVLLLCFWYMSNLSPYLRKHSDVKKAVELLRTIRVHKGIKVNAIKETCGFSEKYLNTLLDRYSKYNLIQRNGQRLTLGPALKDL